MQKRFFLPVIAGLLLSLLTVHPASAQRWAVVDFSTSYLRAAPDYESALETQALMDTGARSCSTTLPTSPGRRTWGSWR